MLSLAALALAGLTLATPQLQGGFIQHCDTYFVTDHGEAYGHLQATCNLTPNDPKSERQTTLDLNLCLGNYKNHLDWGAKYVHSLRMVLLSSE